MDQSQNAEVLEKKEEENLFDLDVRITDQRVGEPDTNTQTCTGTRYCTFACTRAC
ncbi:hypothetical protein [Ktedonosporobacter rubrisoli]|uniref:hypothetical protein n=1 Tax=Ktedonosporobacter rubrisoli TaxID=2509675 RepID=UPI0013EE7DD4|nr:hypothetical protein [Ktedonosporobacter rubrisoli]